MAYRTILIIAAICVWGHPGAQANELNRVISYTCDRQNYQINIGYEVIVGTQPKYFDAELSGKYDPGSLIDIVDDGDKTVVVWSGSIKKECDINKRKYTIIIEPQVFNTNVLGRCGAALSGAAIVYRKNKVVLERTPFEEDCNDLKPMITNISIDVTKEEIIITRVDPEE
jgi:hypothetical protein